MSGGGWDFFGSDGRIKTLGGNLPAGASGLVKLYDSGALVADAASIDTGAGGIAAGYDVLEIWFIGRSDEAVIVSDLNVLLNGDSGANYDTGAIGSSLAGTAVTTSLAVGDSSIVVGSVPGSSAGANIAGVIRMSIPFYTDTTFYKAVEWFTAQIDTTAGDTHRQLRVETTNWHSTAAITQLSIQPATAGKKLKAGSRLIIYGRASLGTLPAADGWTDASSETWTYASGSGGGTATFTVTGDVTAKYTKGTRIKLAQGTTKYFVVTASSFASGTTTVTITAGSDYTLANSAISGNYYSYQANPQGYPGWFNFAPATSGFSSITVAYAKFSVVGNACTIAIRQTGTSNAGTFNMTAPISFADFGVTNVNFATCVLGTDNGSSVQSSCVFSSATNIRVDKAITAADGWTGSGTKSAVFQLVYPI